MIRPYPGTVLNITAEVHRQMVDHAMVCLPNEACGLFAGAFGSNQVDVFYPMTNAAESPVVYRLDPREQMATEDMVDGAGLAILGVMHSHTLTTAYPSPTDVQDAAHFDSFGEQYFVIVSLKHPEPAMRSYKILGDTIAEHPVEITPGE